MATLRPSRSMARLTGPARWTTARLVSTIIGALFALGSLGFLAGYAVTSGATAMFGAAGGWEVIRSLFGTVRIRVTLPPALAQSSSASPRPTRPVTICPGSATTPSGALPITTPAISGTAVALRCLRPGVARIWAMQAAGRGTQTLAWPASGTGGMAVVMNVTGSRPVGVRINAATSLPALPWIGAGLLIGGSLLVAAGFLIAVPARRMDQVTPRPRGA